MPAKYIVMVMNTRTYITYSISFSWTLNIQYNNHYPNKNDKQTNILGKSYIL